MKRVEGSVDAAREGAREGTVDTGAEADPWSDCGKAEGVGLEGRDAWVSISRVVLGCSNIAVARDSLRKLLHSFVS